MQLPPVEVVRPFGKATIILEVFEEGGSLIAGIYMLKGRIGLRPKAWLEAVRAELTVIEGLARRAGCAETRMAGRNWHRVFPDYEPMPGGRNLLRKRL